MIRIQKEGKPEHKEQKQEKDIQKMQQW